MGFEPFGLTGWRFMFLVEGVPCLILAVLVLRYLTDRPEQRTGSARPSATGSPPRCARKRGLPWGTPTGSARCSGGLKDIRVVGMSVVHFSMIIPIYALAFFLPTIINQMGAFSTLQVGLLTALPYVGASIGLVALAIRSDRANERVYHYAVPAAVGTAGLVVAAFTVVSSPAVALIGFTFGAIGCISTLPCFWSEAPKLLTGIAAAAGIALISSIGKIAGFVAPYMVALIKGEEASASGTTNAILVCAFFLCVAAETMVLVGRSIQRAKGGRCAPPPADERTPPTRPAAVAGESPTGSSGSRLRPPAEFPGTGPRPGRTLAPGVPPGP